MLLFRLFGSMHRELAAMRIKMQEIMQADGKYTKVFECGRKGI